jgi:hypothetical protein
MTVLVMYPIQAEPPTFAPLAMFHVEPRRVGGKRSASATAAKPFLGAGRLWIVRPYNHLIIRPQLLHPSIHSLIDIGRELWEHGRS